MFVTFPAALTTPLSHIGSLSAEVTRGQVGAAGHTVSSAAKAHAAAARAVLPLISPRVRRRRGAAPLSYAVFQTLLQFAIPTTLAAALWLSSGLER